MKKRGISPLIATVLIIGFTVALATIIITWGGGYIQGEQERVSETTSFALQCTKLRYEVVDVTCNAGTNVLETVRITSNTDIEIPELILRVKNETNAISVFDSEIGTQLALTPTTGLDSFGSVVAALTGGPTDPRTIEVIAKIDDGGVTKACGVGSRTYTIDLGVYTDCDSSAP